MPAPGDGTFKLRPELNRALTERCHPRDNKGLRDKHVKSSHHKKRSKSIKDHAKAKEDDKPKEPEGIVTSTGAIMIPVTQQYWWRAGPDSDVADSDFDDEIISGRVIVNLHPSYIDSHWSPFSNIDMFID